MFLGTKCAKTAASIVLTGRRFLCTSYKLRCEATNSTTQEAREATNSTTQEAPDDHHEQAAEDHDTEVKEYILHSALSYVPELGWSRKAITQGAQAAGYPSLTHGLFPRAGADLVFYFYRTANTELARQLEEDNKMVDDGIKQKKKISIFVRDAVETRLRMLAPYMNRWPQAIGLMALPQNVPEALKNLYTLTDDIWYHAGDRSVDFNYYTKRGSLAAIYKASELHMLQDKSDDFTNTWHFLDRRIENMASFGKLVRQTAEGKDTMADVVWGSLLMGRNVLGMNDRQR